MEKRRGQWGEVAVSKKNIGSGYVLCYGCCEVEGRSNGGCINVSVGQCGICNTVE